MYTSAIATSTISIAHIMLTDQTTSLNLFVSNRQIFLDGTNPLHLVDLRNPYDDCLNRGLLSSIYSEKSQ